ncbi:MAG: glutamate racemase [Crocinitomicaceae bacterium TMED114]|nr:MAG: glutamate racemase [Crocinitomicaceae bacterium TMED114]
MSSSSSRPSLASKSPIGVFDSGIGGLTVAHAISRAMPAEPISYFGDTAHMPYGDRSPELVQSWSVRIAEHLVSNGCKAIVIACNSASATAAEAVRDAVGPAVPVIDVITPVAAQVAAGEARRIGVIGTRATVGSGVYGRCLRDAMAHQLGGASGRSVEEWATPLLAPLIEEGWHEHALMEPVIAAYLEAAGWSADKLDALIPGCTHYPLALDALRKVLGPGVELVNGPDIVAAAVAQRLADSGLLSTSGSTTHHRFAVSDLTPSFADSARRFFGSGIQLDRDALWD